MKQTTVILLLFIFPSFVMAYTLSGRVLRVDSGNRVTIVDSNNVQHTVRLQDVRVPGASRVEGQQSLSHLQRLIGGKHVTFNYGSKTDRQVLTGRIYLGETDINLKQIEDGWAKYQPSGTADDNQIADQYEAAQDKAMHENRGIWYTPHKRPGPAIYERRLVVPSEPLLPEAKQHYPPLPTRRHYIFPVTPGPGAELPENAAQYAPLVDRARTPYGHGAGAPKVPPAVVSNGVQRPRPPIPVYGPISPPRILYPQWQR